ncbi:hypothetical protein BDZ89DRAFT_1059069 [Hymenopellis radicata]|nr:hypothetical protein BDZ89DRAFT_1059069 [Hymenopellis radicata]
MRLTRSALKSFAARWKDAGGQMSGETLNLENSLVDLIFLSRTHAQLSRRDADPDVTALLSWVTTRDSGHGPDDFSLGQILSQSTPSASNNMDFSLASTAGPATRPPRVSHSAPRKKLAQTRAQQKKKPTLPHVAYSQEKPSRRIRSGESAKTVRPKRSHRQKQAYKARILNEMETYAATNGLNTAIDLPITTTGWMGLRAGIPQSWARILRDAHRSEDEVWEFLDRIQFLPYNGQATQVLDAEHRRIIFRSKITPGMAALAAEFGAEAAAFVKACKPPSDSDIAGNLRGNHWFCIAGADRNNKSVPALSKWHEENAPIIKEYFCPKRVFNRANGIANDLVAILFPAIAARFQACADYMRTNHKMEPMFGRFWNWCLNAPLAGVKRVFCDPHVDFKNLALAVCVVFVYGIFNHREKAWLVIWEAGICLELPPGVFLLYPSSLFYHFNVDIVTTPDGARPTQQNSTPLSGPTLTRPANVSEEDWEAGNGRGSVVWFNQASMFQTSETGFNTLAEARLEGYSGNADIGELLGMDGALPRV